MQHEKWVPNQFSCFDTHLNVLRYPMDLTSFSLDFFYMKFSFFTPPAFSESLYFLFSYRSLYFSFRYFLVISRRISNNLFFDQLPGFVCFLCSGFFRFEKWNETYVFGGLYLLYLDFFKYEPFRFLCFVLSFFLLSLLYSITSYLSICF